LHLLGDIAERRTAERSIAEGVARFGRIDTLINNAGVFVAKHFTQDSDGRLRGDFRRRPGGILSHEQLVITEMKNRPRGKTTW